MNNRRPSKLANKHWSQAFFTEIIISVQPLQGSYQHQTDIIELQDHSKWVCKTFSKHSWLGTSSPSQIAFTASLTVLVAAKLGSTFAPVFSACLEPNAANSSSRLIFPYCEGRVTDAVTEIQAFKLGGVLAQLHALRLPQDKAKMLPEIQLPATGTYPAWVSTLVEHCNKYHDYDAENMVVSHRDIHLHNVVWKNEDTPHLIDWESAGLIHPFVELIGLASNCSGLAVLIFDKKLFQAALAGYANDAKQLPRGDNILWGLTLHTWLLWYAYALSQGWQENARQTLQTINFIRGKLRELKRIYIEAARDLPNG
ncbi:aminoglycoside phosphotransferase [Legionella lansingensis]|uniref:Putative aminoglycoside phosphotransferase n=1 Tax=Legionella lansingensis TaxID=45067 RepID=A0A0W0VPU2_9GAMM|nr:phosphotransferase [Legionella lansingensis]KTD22180.1 putative aminoglycoside phosphotransferase [Legionella lansingensis]SNV54751.1 aminoglycoside phosphotransferase [Legionella lansingensis]